MFFKLWAVGNGGMECYEKVMYIGWANSEDDLDGDTVENWIGPLSGGVRSVHWEIIENPNRALVLREMKIYEGKINSARSMLDELSSMDYVDEPCKHDVYTERISGGVKCMICDEKIMCKHENVQTNNYSGKKFCGDCNKQL